MKRGLIRYFFVLMNYLYYLCEHYGGKIGCWAWNKRWKDRKTGFGYKK